MVVKRKRSCQLKDRSPLGLLGILMITVGVIIAIYDAKDALPNQSQSYVVVIGVLLILMGVVSVVLAFLGYRRSRAMARENMGTKIKGKNKKKWAQKRQFRRVSIGANHHAGFPTSEYVSVGEKGEADGPAIISLPQNYNMTLPSHLEQTQVRGEGVDNFAYEKTPTHAKPYTLLDNLVNYQGTAAARPSLGNNGNRDTTDRSTTSGSEHSYTPPLPSWSSMEVAEYITPVSTTV